MGMKKFHYMRTAYSEEKGRDITTVYECDAYVAAGNAAYYPITKTSKPIAAFTHAWRAEKFINKMRLKSNDN